MKKEKRVFRLFVTSSHLLEALSVVRGLGKEGHMICIGVPHGEFPSAAKNSAFAKETFTYPNPLFFAKEFQQWFKKQVEMHQFDGVFAVSEVDQVVLNQIRNELPPSFHIYLPNQQALNCRMDPIGLFQKIRSMGIDVPAHVAFSDEEKDDFLANHDQFYLFSAPRFRDEVEYESCKSWIFQDEQSLQDKLRISTYSSSELGLQEVLHGQLFYQTMLRLDGELIASFASKKSLHEGRLLHNSYESMFDQELFSKTKSILDAFDLEGLLTLCFMRPTSDDRLVFMHLEVAFHESLPLAGFLQLNFPQYWIDKKLDQGRPDVLDAKQHVVMKNRTYSFIDAFVGGRKSLSSRFSAIVDEVSSLFNPNVRGLQFWWQDPMPSFVQLVGFGQNIVQSLSDKRNQRDFENSKLELLTWKTRLHKANTHSSRYFSTFPEKLLFVCFGNICLSPYASEYWKHLQGNNKELPDADSAGLYPKEGRCTPSRILEITDSFHVSLAEHPSREICRKEVEEASAIFVMDVDNYIQLLERFPQEEPKIFLLGMFSSKKSKEILDPYYLDKDNAIKSYHHLTNALEGLKEQLLEDFRTSSVSI